MMGERRAIETETTTLYPVAVGDFVTIPTWRTTGMVLALTPAWSGPDGSFRALIQEHPKDDKGTWYTLEPEGVWYVD
jgi:hypothetical protein